MPRTNPGNQHQYKRVNGPFKLIMPGARSSTDHERHFTKSMRKVLKGAVLSVVVVVLSFLMEPLFPLGDWRWIILIVFGVVVYVLLGTHGDRIGRTVGKFWNWFFRQPKSRTATVPASRVPTSVDPEQSEVSYYGPNGLMVAVFMTVENHLDVKIRLKKLALDVEMVAECLNCRFLEFQPCLSLDRVKTVGNIMVPARQAVEGWAHFQCKDDIRIVDFRRFVFVAQAIGEPEQVYTFEPYDWDHARRGQSTIVMPPPGTDT